MNIFEMWLEGVKIIVSFLPIGMAMILLPALLYFALARLIEALFGEAIFANILFNYKTYKEVRRKIKQKIKDKRTK